MDIYYNTFLMLKQFLINSGKNYNIDLVTRAFEYATSLHEGQYRQSGEDYICHPVSVAKICADFGYDTDSICTALLHDVVEDCPEKTNLDEIKELFGENIAILVDGLTKLQSMHFSSKDEATIQNLRKMFFAMSKDPRVMLIKLCDRLHNMRTISPMDSNKQKIIALETMHVFAPVAHRLGIHKIKSELEDLCLQCLDSYGYKEVKNAIDKKYGESRDLIERSKEKIKEKLLFENIKFTIEGRVKTVYSMYRKIFTMGKSFDSIYDFYALRIVVNNLEEVYRTLGIIHDLFSYVQDRFKDYISTPKPNGYQSIHTTVVNEKGIPFEIQIRTKEMHDVAEYGVAAHWKYKSGEKASEDIAEKLKWLKTLVEMEQGTDSEEFMSLLKFDLYSDEIFVYTPKGDVKALPKGSTAVDFAYSIHSAVGNKTIGAKINGDIVSIETVLKNNQIIEILTSNSAPGPSRNWLKFVKTGEARSKIRQWFKREKRADNILLGRQEIDRIFRHMNRAFTELQKNEILSNISKREGFAAVDDFYNAIGYGGISLMKITPKIREEVGKLFSEKGKDEGLILDVAQIPLAEEKYYSYNADIIVDGIDNCQTKLAKCCNPLPGDDIEGFMTKGHGMSVHKSDCPNYVNLKNQHETKDRFFEVMWNTNNSEISESGKNKKDFKAFLKVSAVNDIKLFAALSTTLAEMKVSIHAISEAKVKADGNVVIDLVISTRNVEHLNYIISRLKNIKNVSNADRGYII